MQAPAMKLDGASMSIPIPAEASLATFASVLDRALAREGRRVVRMRDAEGRDLLAPALAASPIGEASSVEAETGKLPEKPKLAVASLNIGSKYQEMFDISSPTFEAYAKRLGADYLVIDAPKVGMGHVFFEKWQIFETLLDYDRVLYVDGDALIAPDCPDVFALVPPTHFGGFVEDDFSDRMKFIIGTQMNYGEIGWRKGYINAGVYVCSWLHRPLFERRKALELSSFAEQNLMNYRLQLGGFPLMKLPKELNRMDLCGPDRLAQGMIIHYAGLGYTAEIDPAKLLKARVERMRADWQWLQANRAPKG